MKVLMFTPTAADIASIYLSMSPPVGMQTIGAHVTFGAASNIFQV